jgi:hypothetical protein
MRQLHLALKNSVGKNAEWIHTASLNEQGKAVLINIATGKVIEDEPDVYCAKVFSGRALKLAA